MGRLIMKKFRSILKVFAIVLVCLVGFSVVYLVVSEGIHALDTAIGQGVVGSYYPVSDDGCVYVDSNNKDTANVALVDEVLSALPDTVSGEIRDSWMILVAEENPFDTSIGSFAAAATHYRAKVIWLGSEFTEEKLVHEIGHAYSSSRALDYSGEFRDIYKAYWEQCSEISEYEYRIHDTGTTSELFAFLFEQYVCHADELEENFKDGYDYMEGLFAEQRNSFLAIFTDPVIKNYNTFSRLFGKIGNSVTTVANVSALEGTVENNSLIEVSDYTPVMSLSGLNDTEEALLADIFAVIENPDAYPTKTLEGEDVVVIEHDGYVTLSMYNKLIACTDCYFGKEFSEVFDVHASKTSGTSRIYIRPDVAKELLERREFYLEKVDEALSGLHEGTETQKLLQISKYITKNCKYNRKDATSLDDFFVDGTGDCVTYAMAFRMFCERIGIHCDIICGAGLTGEGHIWNRVRLSTGEYRYYDLTGYAFGTLDMPEYNEGVTLTINGY